MTTIPRMTADEMALPDPLALTKKHIVLLVDDEPEILASLRRLLVNEPYEILTTEKPEQALEWIKAKVVSLVVSDQVMPGMLGVAFLDEVRKRSPATQCAILTDYPEGGQLLRRVSQEPLCVISKPWDGDELKRTIRKLLHDGEKR